MKPYPTQAQLKKILHYDPNTGVFTWRIKAAYGTKVGGLAGFFDSHNNYSSIRIGKKTFLAHRLAWIYIYGDTDKVVKHINGIGYDNRIDNLALRLKEKPVKITTVKIKKVNPMDKVINDIVDNYKEKNEFNITPLFLMRNHPITRATAGVICSKLQTLNP